MHGAVGIAEVNIAVCIGGCGYYFAAESVYSNRFLPCIIGLNVPFIESGVAFFVLQSAEKCGFDIFYGNIAFGVYGFVGRRACGDHTFARFMSGNGTV